MKAILCLFLIASSAVFAQSVQRIPLKLTDAYQTNNVNQDVTYLIDGDHNTRFVPGYNFLIQPHNVIFDLSDYAPCKVTRIVLWDGAGSGYNCHLILVHADSGKEDTVFTFKGDYYNKSDTINLPVSKQFVASKLILRTVTGGSVYPDDLELWGTFSLHNDPVWSKPKIPIKNQMGVVAHPWDIDVVTYPEKYQAMKDLKVSAVRIYSDAYADKDAAGNYKLNPEGRGFQTETTFDRFKKESAGILTHICYQNQTLQVKQTWPSTIFSQLNFEYQFNNSRDSVSSYQSIAKDMFVLATRGGKNKNLPDYPVYNTPNWWEPKQQVVKGEGFYDLIEGGNEWNAWWGGMDTYLTGSQLAAAWSMMYDGHKGKYPLSGIKKADPNMMFTNGGIASDQPDIFREAVDWWKIHRGYLSNGSVDIPLDFYSYHSYSSVDGQYGNSKGGIPPEIGMVPKARNMIYFANKYGGGKGVIIGEWGWDVNPNSPLNAPAYGGYTPEQTRAWWAVRGMLKFTEVGVYRSEWYRAYQDYPNSVSDADGQQFATMALLRAMDDNGKIIKRTLVGDYYKQLSEFGDYVFDSAVRSDSINILRFKKDTSYMYTVWAVENVVTPPDSRPIFTERKGSYELQVPLNAILKIRSFKDDGSGLMDSKFDVAAGNTYRVNYSAKPQIIEVLGQAYVLPVQSVSFTAVRVGKTVQLGWSVQNESVSSYVVERSSDGTNFLPIAVVNAAKQKTYRVVDASPFVGNNYYRLKMIDANGTFKYSEIRLVVIYRGKIQYAAYTLSGQQLTEGEDFLQVNFQARAMLKQRQAYIIRGTDGSILKLINNTE
jgi:hypothetical protein